MTLNAELVQPEEPGAGPASQAAPRKRGGGPRTPEGRDRAKRNSVRHGMRAREVFPDAFYRLAENVHGGF